MPGNYNNLKNLQMAQKYRDQMMQEEQMKINRQKAMSDQPIRRDGLNQRLLDRVENRLQPEQRQMNPSTYQLSALNEAMGAPGMANPLNGLSSQGISSTPWEIALSAGGPPTQTGNPWSGEQMERLRLLKPRDRQQLLEALAKQSAPAASPREMQEKFREHQQSQPRSYARPFEAPASGFTQKMIDNHPLTLLKNYIMGK